MQNNRNLCCTTVVRRTVVPGTRYRAYLIRRPREENNANLLLPLPATRYNNTLILILECDGDNTYIEVSALHNKCLMVFTVEILPISDTCGACVIAKEFAK